MKGWHYHYAGLQITSQVELPEWVNFAAAVTAPDVEILLQQAAPCPSPTLTSQGKSLTFSLPEIGCYTVHDGREIVVTPCCGVSEERLRLFLLGSAWGALGYQRGWIPFHAAVIQVGDGAVAFCAPSGYGKSSLVAWLLKQGYNLLCDDLCRLDLIGTQSARLWRSTPRLKLWQEAVHALEWQAPPLCRDQQHLEKFYFPDPTTSSSPAVQTQTLPLRAIYILAWGELALSRLVGLNAVQTIIQSATYRPEFVEALGQTASYWRQIIELVRQIPVFLLQRPRDWAQMPTVGERLLAHLRNLDR